MATRNQRTAAPTNKVAAGVLAGAATTVVLYLVQQVAHVEVPVPVATALTTLISFVIAYLIPNAA